MTELTNGLHEVREPMPCQPYQIYILRWALPNTLGHAEPEEVAARLLSFSQESGRWVGVSLLKIIDQLKAELDADPADAPFSVATVYGANAIMLGINELQEKGFLRIEGKEREQVLFPTPSLIKKIMQAQQVTA